MALPLPKVVYDVEPGGGIITGMKGANAFTRSQFENQIAEAQAKYAPWQAYGNAFLTNQQAKWLPYQYQMQVLSNPLLWMAAQNNPALMNQLKTMMNNPMAAIGGGKDVNIPLPGQSSGGTSGGLLGMLFNKLLGTSGGGQQGTQPQSTNPFVSPSTGGATTNVNAMNNSGQDFGAANRATMQEVNNVANGLNLDGTPRSNVTPNANPSIAYQTPAETTAGQVAGQAGLSGQNPYSASQIQQKTAETAATGQANTQTELQNQRTKQLSTQAQTAIDAKKALHAFHRNYEKSSYRGQYFTPERAENAPTLPGGTVAPEQLTNRYANQFLNYLTGLGNTPAGKTDAGRDLIASGKVDISLEPKAEKELFDNFNAQLTRMETLRDFGTAFYRNNPGATDEDLIGLMNSYNRHAPAYDADTGKSHPENEKKYKDFTTPQALASYRANGDYNPIKGFNPSLMLNYKFKNAQEFKDAFDLLSKKDQKKLIAEMKRRGMK